MSTCAGPVDSGSAVIVREYHSRDMEADFQADAERMLVAGYEPVGQHHVEGGSGCTTTLICVLTIPIGIGIIRLAILLLGRGRQAG